jgi:photosystem II stability/assembly factor-like uncharacterized protein
MDIRERLSPRARRAFPLIAASVLVAIWASVAYLQPSLLQVPKPAQPAKAAAPAVLSPDYSATYAFLTPSLGWALVAETTSAAPSFSVFRTTDAARHWTRQFVRPLNLLSLETFTVRFFDPSHGFIAVGDPAEIYRTADGGTHWTLLKTPNYRFSSFEPADAVHGWLMGWTGPPDQVSPELFATSDRGDTWNALPQAGYLYTDLAFRSSGEGWSGAWAAAPTVYSSVDGGASWQPHTLPSDLASRPCASGRPLRADTPWQVITDVNLLPGQGVVVIAHDYCGHDEGNLSLDGGVTWRALAPPSGSRNLQNVAYQDSSHWWTMQSGMLWKTSDAGRSWKLVSTQNTDWVYFPHVIDAKHAWAELSIPAAGASPAAGLAVTSDGGLHWTQVGTPNPS